MEQDRQRDLFNWQWPPADRYPLNNQLGKVRNWIQQDIKDSRNYLVLTGFSSLAYLIEELGRKRIWQNRSIDIVLGNEPVIREELIKQKLSRSKHNFSAHIADYWLQKGISIKLNGPLLSLIRGIEEGNITFHIHPNLHGKVYVGEQHLLTGSSNFSHSGLETQAEVNVRYGKGNAEYDELKGIAEYYLSQSKAFNDKMLELLNRLLQFVDWDEALARAVAELLEGDWVEKYFKDLHPGQEFTLWPTQRQAIGQALYILDNEGSVLIAEPTGSGKTRIGAHLLAALLNRFWKQGRGNRSKYKIIAPPLVTDNWQEELDDLYFTIAAPVSHGVLSHLSTKKNQAHLKDIQDATVLLVDEAHNYLNIFSNRTQSIRKNKADHVILFTATPINRKWNDLLRMVELLGLDNLSEEAYKAYKKLKRKRGRSGAKPNATILHQLKNYSQKFIVRRTKRELNDIIKRRPRAFKDKNGNLCRFPKHVCKTYSIEESENDIRLGRKVEQLINRLKGVNRLQNIRMTKDQLNEGVDPEHYVERQLRSAAALSRYNIKNCLRSSRAALIEHIAGTEKAIEWAGIPALSKPNTGDIISKLKAIDRLPNTKNIDQQYFPEWIKNEERYDEAVKQEINLLEKINDCAQQISGSRERSKANFLAGLLDTHHHILAFDGIVITHSIIHQLLKKRLPNNTKLVVATGGRDSSGKEKVQKLFSLSAENSSAIGLCTDALSEGVNLQKASAVVFLDMPTVIRKAEQRAGRVDRLDSPHKKINIYWPDDHNVFQLEADKKFINRHDIVDTVIGSNIKVPDKFTTEKKEKIDPETMEKLYEKRQEEDREWSGVDDAFKPVRAFIEEDGLIDQDLYEGYKEVTAKVLSRVSLVKSESSWGFFAIRGTEKRAPKWVLIRNNEEISRDLPEICHFLRTTLLHCKNIETRTEAADRYVREMVDTLNDARIELLPNKRKLALNIFVKLIKKWSKTDTTDKHRDIYKKFQNLFHNHFKIHGYSVDCYEFSQLLLDIYNRYYDKAEEERSKWGKKYNNLRDLRRWLKDNPIAKADLEYLWNNIPTEEPLDKQVAAAIIAIPESDV